MSGIGATFMRVFQSIHLAFGQGVLTQIPIYWKSGGIWTGRSPSPALNQFRHAAQRPRHEFVECLDPCGAANVSMRQDPKRGLHFLDSGHYAHKLPRLVPEAAGHHCKPRAGRRAIVYRHECIGRQGDTAPPERFFSIQAPTGEAASASPMPTHGALRSRALFPGGQTGKNGRCRVDGKRQCGNALANKRLRRHLGSAHRDIGVLPRQVEPRELVTETSILIRGCSLLNCKQQRSNDRNSAASPLWSRPAGLPASGPCRAVRVRCPRRSPRSRALS